MRDDIPEEVAGEALTRLTSTAACRAHVLTVAAAEFEPVDDIGVEAGDDVGEEEPQP